MDENGAGGYATGWLAGWLALAGWDVRDVSIPAAGPNVDCILEPGSCMGAGWLALDGWDVRHVSVPAAAELLAELWALSIH